MSFDAEKWQSAFTNSYKAEHGVWPTFATVINAAYRAGLLRGAAMLPTMRKDERGSSYTEGWNDGLDAAERALEREAQEKT